MNQFSTLKKNRNWIQIKPEEALNWSYCESVKMLYLLLEQKQLAMAFDIGKSYPSPVNKHTNSDWLKHTKIIGINPRITKTYWGIVKYAMTFPEKGIHIMPLWTPGCDESIYARLNWKLSKKWLDPDLAQIGFKTPENQLKLVVNILHALGKVVGFDSVPHTDKFSEEVFIYPEFFEWIKLNPEKTKQVFPPKVNNAIIHKEIENIITNYLKAYGNAKGEKISEKIITDFFTNKIPFEVRAEILFGNDEEAALLRRIYLLNKVRSKGFETVPVVEHAPIRPIDFEKIAKNDIADWAEFTVKGKKEDAGIFNSITPYRWYEINDKGYVNPLKPILPVWHNFIEQTSLFQKEYNFDFLRADMAHVQIVHAHSKEDKDFCYDCEMWKKVKENIQKNTPYFATFAEAFLNEYYIDGIQDMKNKAFDIILGYSCFKFLNQEYIDCIKYYRKTAREHSIYPCITAMTNDSDQLKNKDYHKSPLANEIRYFTMLFLDLPGYTGMGLETRELDPQLLREFSAIFTALQSDEYKWGNNKELFTEISQMREIYENIHYDLSKAEYIWLDLEAQNSIAWIVLNKKLKPKFMFIINLDNNIEYKDIGVDTSGILNAKKYKLKPIYSLLQLEKYLPEISLKDPLIKDVFLGDARIYQFIEI